MNASVTGAGGFGGSVALNARDVLIGGDIRVAGLSSNAVGGQVTVSGEHIGLAPFAVIDARGHAAGGQVVLGDNPVLAMSTHTTALAMSWGSAIDASATGAGGAGGQIILGGDRVLMAGALKASGTATDGVGGQIILTGNHIDVLPLASINARGHAAGGQIVIGNADFLPGGMTTANVDISHASWIDASAVGEFGGGGQVVISADNVRIGGQVKAMGLGDSAVGGEIKVVANNVLISPFASLDVSGNGGDGNVIITTP